MACVAQMVLPLADLGSQVAYRKYQVAECPFRGLDELSADFHTPQNLPIRLARAEVELQNYERDLARR